MQPVAVLFAIFVLSFVAGIGWYAGRGVVQFVAGIVAHGGRRAPARQVVNSDRLNSLGRRRFVGDARFVELPSGNAAKGGRESEDGENTLMK
jgi:hypothetical protein